MKFDPLKWNEVKTDAKTKKPKGRLQLRSTHPTRVFIEVEGYEAFAGTFETCDLEIAEAFVVRTESDHENNRVYILEEITQHYKPTGERFTNVDRRPEESGTVLAIQKELRKFKIEQAAAVRQMKALQRLNPNRVQEVAAPAEPKAEPGQEPDTQPVEEQETE